MLAALALMLDMARVGEELSGRDIDQDDCRLGEVVRRHDAVGSALKLRVEREARDAMIGGGSGRPVVTQRNAREIDPGEGELGGGPSGSAGSSITAAGAPTGTAGNDAPFLCARATNIAIAARPTATPAPRNLCLIRGNG